MSNQSSFITALREPVVILTIVTAIGAGIFSAWWLLPVGLLFAGIMVLRIISSPTAKVNARMSARASLSSEFEEKFNRIESIEIKMYNSASGASGKVQAMLRPVLEDTTELVDEVHAFLSQMATLQNFFLSNNNNNGQDEKFELNQQKLALSLQAQTTDDPVRKQQLLEEIEDLDDQIDRIKDVSGALDHVDGGLAKIENALNNILAETIFLQGQSGSAAKKKVEQLQQMLAEEKADLAKLRANPMR